MKFSLFPHIHETQKSDPITIADFLNGIRLGKWQEIANKIKAEKDKAKRQELKKKVPYATVSGIFEKRLNAGLLEHSGLIAMDFDNLEKAAVDGYFEKLCADPYTYAAFRSISGLGICVIAIIDGNRHLDSFQALESYYMATYGLLVDTQCKDVSRARFISYDPNLFTNPKAKLFKNYLPKKALREVPKVIYGNSDIDFVFKQIEEKRIDLTNSSYDRYLKLAFALHSEYGEGGREYFHRVAMHSEKYDSVKADKQFDYCVRSMRTGIGMATFFYYAKEAGLQIHTERTTLAATVAKQTKKAGRDQESAKKTLAMEGIKGEDADKIIEQVYNSNIDLKTGDSLSILGQLELFLQTNYRLKRNEITRYIENAGQPLETPEMNSIYIKAKKVVDDKVNFMDLEKLINSEFTEDYNPILDFFDTYRSRNETGLIKRLANTIETDTGKTNLNVDADYFEHFLTKWLVGMIASVHGHHSPLLLALTGGQNSGKCLAKGTKVLMFDTSVKNVEDIVVGDELLGLNGTKRTVLQLGNGIEQMYLVKQSKGIDYTVNASHILSLKYRKTGETLNINIEDYINLSGKHKRRLAGYKSEIINKKDSELSIDPYFLGLWLGDGQASLHAGLKIESADDVIVNYLQDYCNRNNLFLSNYIQEKSKSNCYGIVSAKGKGFGVKRPKHKTDFKELNLDNNKHIPVCYKKSSKKQRLALLAGIIDSDGHLSGTYYEVTQSRKTLAEDICFLANSVGLRANIKIKTVNNKPYYRITIAGNISIVPVLLDRKRKIAKNTYNDNLTTITVEKGDIGEYYGFTIDGDSLFLLSDFTVTHNTEWFRRLLPEPLQRYYAESKLDAGKDDEILMCQKLLIMDDELGGKSKKDEKTLKTLTSKKVFSLREPYGKKNVDLKRLAVLAGTTNETAVLNDPTGNRRIIPINVLKIDHSKYNAIDKISLIMEAFHLYQAGIDWNLDRQDIDRLNQHTKEFEQVRPEYELITQYFGLPGSNGGIGKAYVTATQIKSEIEKLSGQRLSASKIGIELHAAGFIQKMETIEGRSHRLYAVVRLNRDAFVPEAQEKPPVPVIQAAKPPAAKVVQLEISEPDDEPF